MAISGQFMNRNNYRVILEELFKADSLQRSLLPPYADSMGPPDQVSVIHYYFVLNFVQVFYVSITN